MWWELIGTTGTIQLDQRVGEGEALAARRAFQKANRPKGYQEWSNR
jgi:hypothetical protein